MGLKDSASAMRIEELGTDQTKLPSIFHDDILILCKTKRQMLHERHLTLSRKKSRMGRVKDGFHSTFAVVY